VRALIAVIKQTLRASLRSHVALVLLLLNLLAVFSLPVVVTGDGTAVGDLQVALIYSTRVVTVLLSLAAVWLGCAGLSREIEAYNLHLVMTKPAHAWTVWLGKWLGVFLMTGGTFILSCALIQGLVALRVNRSTFPADQRDKAANEVLVGRRVFRPATPDFKGAAVAEYTRMKQAGNLEPEHRAEAVISELERQIKARSTEIPAGMARTWRFTGLRVPDADRLLYVRYRVHVNSTSQSQQRETVGNWAVINPDAPPEKRVAISGMQRIMGGSFHEFAFLAEMVSPEGVVLLEYSNGDPQEASAVFQVEDGPELLLRVSGFAGNWWRGVAVGLLRLALLAALGCAAGAAFSAPVAVFVSLAYLLLGAVVDTELGAPTRDAMGSITAWTFTDALTQVCAQAVDKTVVSFRAFDVSKALTRGHVIEWARLARLLLFQVLLRGGPLIALGIWVLSRRELGKVIRR